MTTRRQFSLGLCARAGTAALQQKALAGQNNIEAAFSAIEAQCGGRLGAFVVDTGSGVTTGWRANSRFPFCSSFKGLLAAFVLWKADRGQLRLDQLVHYGPPDLLSYAPITRAYVGAGALTFDALCAAAAEYSDNTAANLLLRETGGPGALTAWVRSQGDPAFQLSYGEPKLNYSRFGELNDTTTPQAMAESYRRFVLGEALAPASRSKLAGWLVANTTGGKRLRAGLPSFWRVGDKTGTYDGKWFSTVDIAIAWPPGRAPLVIAGFVTDTADTSTAERALADVGRFAKRRTADLRP